MVVEITTNGGMWVYLIMILISLFLIIRYKKEFDTKDLLDYFIYLTNKVSLIFIFGVFLFMFLFTLVGFSESNLNIFLTENIRGLLYYGFFTYFTLFGLNLIYFVKDIIVKGDLWGMSLINKEDKNLLNKK